jgi:hypothetical protein
MDAAYFLIDHEHQVPDECAAYDDRFDIGSQETPHVQHGVVNYCANCLRLESKAYKVKLDNQIILDALGESTMVGREIAARAGLRFDATFRARLRRLVLASLLTRVPKNPAGEKGYRRR